MHNLLNDESKFVKLKFNTRNNELDYILEQEKIINDYLKKLVDKGSLSPEDFKNLKASGSQPGILHGLCKVHKKCDGSLPPFRPILSAINTPSYKLAKFFVPLLSELTFNDYVIKDSFSFADNVRAQNSSFFMSSFDIDSLFTNIPLDETINICSDKLFKKKKKIKGLNKSEFTELLRLSVKNSFFLFNGQYFKQLDGVAMGSPLGPTLANIFLCHWEEIWIKKCPKQFSPLYYKRYMDDTFLLFSSSDKVNKFHKYINSRHKNMKFTFEIEENNCLPFLDILISREQNSFKTSVYRKPTFSGLYSNFMSFMPILYKKGLIKTLFYRAFMLCCDWNRFHKEVSFLKDTFRKNKFPVSIFEMILGEFLNKVFIKKRDVFTVPKKEIFMSLPFLGPDSFHIKKRILTLFKTYYPQFKLRLIFKCSYRLRNCFVFKDKVPINIRSHILYRFSCGGCNSTYIGKSKRHFLVRVNEHLGISLRTGKNFKFNPNNKNNSAILSHIQHELICKENSSIKNFSIVGNAISDAHLCIKESLLIQKESPQLNQSVQSVPLKLFD